MAVAQTSSGCCSAVAGDKSPVVPPLASNPEQTTVTYGDWVLRCAQIGEDGPGPQTCEIVQTLVLQGQQQPIAQVALGGVDKTAALRLTVVVPTAWCSGTPANATSPCRSRCAA